MSQPLTSNWLLKYRELDNVGLHESFSTTGIAISIHPVLRHQHKINNIGPELLDAVLTTCWDDHDGIEKKADPTKFD